MKELSVALVGNPNVGKTSLFNRLTRSFDHVGNYPGVTVTEKSKTVSYKSRAIKITDLPGLYSLTALSPDEETARDCVLNAKSDLVLGICDSKCPARSLYLMLQLIEAGKRVAIVFNMADELKLIGKRIDTKKISSALGLPVAVVSAKTKAGIDEIRQLLSDFTSKNSVNAYLPYMEKLQIKKVCKIVGGRAEKAGLNPEYAAIKLLENDADVIEKLSLSNGELSEIRAFGVGVAEVAAARYEYIDELLCGAFVSVKKNPRTLSAKIDKVVLNKYLALPIFLMLVSGAFFITFGLLGHRLAEAVAEWVTLFNEGVLMPLLNKTQLPSWCVMLICDGIVGGAGSILAFLPEIVLLFFFLSLLEDSGYISRVAFATDGFFRKIGLTGRAAFTLIMGFGCSATAVLTARGIDDERVRKKTAMLTPYMSCSAKLPVYSMICSVLFPRAKALVILLLYLLGVVVAIAIAAFTEKRIKRLSGVKSKLIIELPPYRAPSLERVIQLLLHHTKNFIVKIGSIVLALSVSVWILSNFSLVDGFGAAADKSIMATLGGILAPVFSPLGFGNWKAVSALLSGIAAKEAVVATLNALGGVLAVFSGKYAIASGAAFLTFTLLYIPCVATVAVLLKETGGRFTAIVMTVQLAVAYLVSLFVRLVVIAFCVATPLAVCVTVAVAALCASALAIKAVLTKNVCCGGECAFCSKKCKQNANKNERIVK